MPTKEHKFEVGTLVHITDMDREGRISAVSFHAHHTVPLYAVVTSSRFEAFQSHYVPEPGLTQVVAGAESEP